MRRKQEFPDSPEKLYAYSGHGYPLFYYVRSSVLCADCARKVFDEIDDWNTNWEDPGLFCDDCGARIESAYAEDQQEARNELSQKLEEVEAEVSRLRKLRDELGDS